MQIQKRQEINRTYGLSRSNSSMCEVPDEEFKVFMAIARYSLYFGFNGLSLVNFVFVVIHALPRFLQRDRVGRSFNYVHQAKQERQRVLRRPTRKEL